MPLNRLGKIDMLTTEEIIARFYVGYFNRAPDPAGFAFWVDALERGTPTLDIANFFSEQVETRALYPFFGDPNNSDPEQFIKTVYLNLFNREPDDPGLAFWMEALTSGGVSTGQMIEEIIYGAVENPDLAVVQNKVASGIYWEDQANNFANFDYENNASAKSSATSALSVVSDDVATIATSQSQSNAFFAGLTGDKTDPEDDLTEDGNPDDKVGIAGSQEGISSDVSISTLNSDTVINLEAFRGDARFAGIDGSGQTVVVIDTGIDLDHPAFGPDIDGNGVSDRIIFSRDFTNERDGTANDIQGHGSNVASIVASSAGNFPGVAPGANIVALQALDRNGSGSSEGIEDALRWVVQNAEALNIVAVNMSLGDSTNFNNVSTHPVYGDELRALSDTLGVTTIVAAGNDYENFQREGASSLSADPNTIAIGAIGGEASTGGDVTYFSQRSDDIPTIFAPGSGIVGAAPGGGSSPSSGTSQAAPHVAGMVALAQQLAQQTLGRRLTPDEFATLLQQSGDTFVDDEDPFDRVINTGSTYTRADMFDLGEAILALAGGTPVPPPPQTDPGEPSQPGSDIPGTIDTTSTIVVGSTQTSSIDFSQDDDFFAVTLTPGEYEISLRGAASGVGTLSDPYLTLLSSSGSFVTSNDDGGTGLESLIEFEITQGGQFFINASAFGSAVGTYELGVERIGGATGDIGDTIGTASTLSVGASVTSELDFGSDRDWFAIELTAGQTYTFELVGGTLADPYLYLFDNSGAIVAADDDSGDGLNSSLTFVADGRSGTYYLSAEAYATTDTGTYTLSATGTAGNAGDLADNPSTTGSLDAVAGVVSQSLEEIGDRDWFRIDLTAGSSYEFSLEGAGTTTSLRDPFLYLYDGSGNLIGSDDDGGEGLFSMLSFDADTAGTYFLGAGAYGDGLEGDYVIRSTQITGGTDGDVPGDRSTTATLTDGQTLEGSIDVAGDTDWYGVNVTAGQTYQFSMVRGGSDAMDDPFLTLLNAQGNLIDLNDDANDRDSFIEFVATQNGRVFIAASAYDTSQDTGTYQLSLSSLSTAPVEVPDNASTPFSLTPGQEVEGLIDTPGDEDWYAVDIDAGVTYYFGMFRDDTGTAVNDPFLVLYNADGSTIVEDDDSGGELQSLIIFTSANSGRAYLSAETFNQTTDSGTYVISMDTDSTLFGGSGGSAAAQYDTLL